MAGTGGGDPEDCGAERFSGLLAPTPPLSEARKGLVAGRLQAPDGRAGGARSEGLGGEGVAAGRGAGPPGAWAQLWLLGAGGRAAAAACFECGMVEGARARRGLGRSQCLVRCRDDLGAAPVGGRSNGESAEDASQSCI